MSAPRLTVKIDRLRVSGMQGADAQALADNLQASLRAQLAAQLPGSLGAMTSQDMSGLSVSLPTPAGQTPSDRGREAGRQIATTLGQATGQSAPGPNGARAR